MVRAWRMVKLPCIAMGTARNMLVDQRGKILSKVLKSSTSCTLHSLQGFAMEPSKCTSPSVIRAARFKHLQEKNQSIPKLFISEIDHSIGCNI